MEQELKSANKQKYNCKARSKNFITIIKEKSHVYEYTVSKKYTRGGNDGK